VGGKPRPNALAGARRPQDRDQSGVHEAVGGELVAAGEPVEVYVGFGARDELGGAGRDGAQDGAVPMGQRAQGGGAGCRHGVLLDFGAYRTDVERRPRTHRAKSCVPEQARASEGVSRSL